MNYKTVTYQRVKNLGNYESERLEMTAELEPNDDIGNAVYELRLMVHNLLVVQSVPPKEAPDIDMSDF